MRVNAAVQDAQDVRQLDLFVSGRVRSGKLILWACTTDEAQVIVRRLARITPGARVLRAVGRESIHDDASGGSVQFVHSPAGMVGWAADHVVIQASKRRVGLDGLGHSFEEHARICTEKTTKQAPILADDLDAS